MMMIIMRRIGMSIGGTIIGEMTITGGMMITGDIIGGTITESWTFDDYEVMTGFTWLVQIGNCIYSKLKSFPDQVNLMWC